MLIRTIKLYYGKKPQAPADLVYLVMLAFALLVNGQVTAAERPQRFELASVFHPADPFFGNQLEKLLTIVKREETEKVKFRRSRKTRGFSAVQAVQLINASGIDVVLLDPIGLGFRPAISQVFGGLPFGPEASEIVKWSESTEGRKIIDQAFQSNGTHVLLCGHANNDSGVFSRDEFIWPDVPRGLTIHSQGLSNEIYQQLNIAARPLPRGDLYLGYASGVVDLLVSLNPLMDARAGFAQVSNYFYYPSWERNSVFALLVVNLKKWQSLPARVQTVIADACDVLNQKAVTIDTQAALVTIANQGAGNTRVEPWPPMFLNAAEQAWREVLPKLMDRHKSLVPALEALNILNSYTK